METGRRSFFRHAALGAVAGAVVATRADAAASASPPVALPKSCLRTAVSLTFQPSRGPNEEAGWTGHEVESRDGFIPVAVSGPSGQGLQVVIRDEERVVLDVCDEAFRHGPIDFWYAPVGKLRVDAWTLGSPSWLPLAIVVIHGEVDLE